jgi:hypothetical protein
MVYSPADPVTVARLYFCRVLSRVTAAFGMTEPVGSVTVPLRLAVPTWAWRQKLKTSTVVVAVTIIRVIGCIIRGGWL